MAVEAAAKASAYQDRSDHETAMAVHMGQHAMATALAVGATNEEAIALGMAAHIVALGAGDTMHMQD